MIALALLQTLQNSQGANDVRVARAFIEKEFAQHVREFKENDPRTIANFWFRNCLAGFEQFGPEGKRSLYDNLYQTYQYHPNGFQKNLDRIMRLVKIEKTKEGYAVLAEQGWTALTRMPTESKQPPNKVQTHSLVQELWLKTRKGYGLKLTEILFFQQGQFIDTCPSPRKIWNGRPPEVPKALLDQFRPRPVATHK